MPNEHKRSTEIFRCSLNSQRKFSIVFLPFLGTIYLFQTFSLEWSTQENMENQSLKIIEKNKKGNLFPVHLDLKKTNMTHDVNSMIGV